MEAPVPWRGLQADSTASPVQASVGPGGTGQVGSVGGVSLLQSPGGMAVWGTTYTHFLPHTTTNGNTHSTHTVAIADGPPGLELHR